MLCEQVVLILIICAALIMYSKKKIRSFTEMSPLIVKFLLHIQLYIFPLIVKLTILNINLIGQIGQEEAKKASIDDLMHEKSSNQNLAIHAPA